MNAATERAGFAERLALAGEAPPLLTIGYGARSFEQFLATLQAYQVEYLLDVRTSPYSKFKPEFSREPLEAALKRHGIRYVFLGESLGGQPREPACYTDGKVDYDKVRRQPFFQAGLERLRKAHEQRLRVALMCSEGKPEHCHRSKMIGQALVAAGLPVAHIDEDDQLLTHTQVMDRLTGGQLDFFGGPPLASRKRYGPASDEAAEAGP
jgi:uncharacterized protein (DUF488 family)